MTDYKHIVERLRRKAEIDRLLERPDSADFLEQAANAIEELEEKLHKERGKVRHLKNVADELRLMNGKQVYNAFDENGNLKIIKTKVAENGGTNPL